MKRHTSGYNSRAHLGKINWGKTKFPGAGSGAQKRFLKGHPPQFFTLKLKQEPYLCLYLSVGDKIQTSMTAKKKKNPNPKYKKQTSE